jgi:hypothetical protein
VSTPAPAVYSFLPWVRRGASTGIVEPEDVTQTTLAARASFTVETTVNSANPDSVDIALYGPGDVVGFDPLQIIRTEPKPFTSDFEPNYLAAVEFDLPDFVWMMTPANPKSGAKLRPWICLVVVPRGPDVELRYEAGATLPVLSILQDAGRQLPNLAESWAWAHAQVSGDLTAQQTLEAVLAGNPERTLSRLVCPRRLEADTDYVACVVPATMAGVEAGLGSDVTTTDLTPAWTSGDAEAHLPVYFSWEFSTGRAGDFESLARLLQPGPPPPGVGQQGMDISATGIGLSLTPNAPGSTLGFEGALRSPATQPTPWPDPPRGPFQAKLREVLDAPATLSAQDPSKPGALAPPIYGGFHAGRRTVPTGRPHWLRELNLDPRSRAAAGLGTRVVQEQQEQLMEAAWQQVGEIDKANEALRRAQLARAVGVKLHEAHLKQLSEGTLLQVSAPAHARVLMSPHTLELQVRRSALPDAALSTAFRRIARPSGPPLRRLAPAASRTLRPVVERLNAGQIEAAGPRTAPDGTVELDGIADRLLPAWLPRWLRPLLPMLVWIVLALAFLLAGAAVVLGLLVSWAPAAPLFAAAAVVAGLAVWLRLRLRRWLLVADVTTATLTSEAVAAAPARPDWQPLPPGTETPPSPTSGRPGPDSEVAARFRAAARAKQRELQAIAEAPEAEPSPPLALEEIRQTLLERLDPRLTVPAAVRGRLELPEEWEPDDPIATVMAAPQFDSPMYEPLRDLAKDALLPGVDEIQPNTVTLLETNPAFIEAYMVGLNHELGRELLWRGYPTDQRGSSFRQFWDPRGHVPAPKTDAERNALKDVPPIHTWPGRNHLGETEAAGKPRGLLVLLVRGQLLNRYPTTVIYASKADSRPNTPDRKPLHPPQERYPVFRGSFPPDITFLGFDLSLEEAKGGPTPHGRKPDPGPGWFFVFQQQPTEPRFGLDEDGPAKPATWSDLSWEAAAVEDDHLSVAATKTSLATAGSPLAAAWAADAGALAVQTLQTPFRVAISADDMLP